MPGSTIGNQTILKDHRTALPPHIVAFQNSLYLAWIGESAQLHVMRSTDGGKTFSPHCAAAATSDHTPFLCVHHNQLFIAWTSSGDQRLNVAIVPGAGGDFTSRWSGDETSHAGPSLASQGGVLYLGWTGADDQQLKVLRSLDNGRTFRDKHSYPEQSAQGPWLCAHNSRLYIAWTRDGKNHVARVEPGSLVGKVTPGGSSTLTPCLTSVQGYLYLAWADAGDGLLSGVLSLDDGASFGFKSSSPTHTSALTPALCTDNDRAWIAWTGADDGFLNIAQMLVSLPRRGTLTSGQYLAPGSKLASPNGMFTLTYTKAGTLVLKNWKHQTLWSSNASSGEPMMAVYQADGNLCCYDTSNHCYWSSDVAAHDPHSLTLRGDGNLVSCDAAEQARWQTQSAQELPSVTGRAPFTGDTLNPGDELVSSDRAFSLRYHKDGNVVVYDAHHKPLWTIDTNDGSRAQGHLVVHDSGTLLFDPTSAPEDLRAGDSRLIRFAHAEPGFTGAEKALLITIGLGIVLLVGSLVSTGSTKAGNDARRTLLSQGGELAAMGSVGEVPQAGGGSSACGAVSGDPGGPGSPGGPVGPGGPGGPGSPGGPGGMCGAVSANPNGGDSGSGIGGACAAVAGASGVCGAVAGGLAACGADGAGVGICGGAVAAGSACGGAVAVVGACGAAVAGAGACGAAATVVGACAAAASGASVQAVGVTAAGACGAEGCGAAACGGAVSAAGACAAEAKLGGQLVGACALALGLCGAVACIALPIGGNW